MIKRVDFSRENRPFWLFRRVPILHSVEPVLFDIDNQYNYILQSISEKHNQYAAFCPASETFLPAAVNPGTEEITLAGSWPVGREVMFTSTNALPPPLAAGVVYFVQAIGVGTIILSTSYGGGILNLTGAGVGIHTIRPAPCPAISFDILATGPGEGWHYAPVPVDLFASPGETGVDLKQETAPADTTAYSVNFGASPRKPAKILNYPFDHKDTIQIRITGQTINNTANALDNLPSYVDVVLFGRYYPENRLRQWGGKVAI